jgi:hypothetical protein
VMAHGACTVCGCALEECIRDQNCPGEIGRFVRPAPRKDEIYKVRLSTGDWVRVRTGHALAGAAGVVVAVDRLAKPILVTLRQLNGQKIRIPLGLLEFVGYAGSEPDVL